MPDLRQLQEFAPDEETTETFDPDDYTSLDETVEIAAFEEDQDPLCACGVPKSEHDLLGCPEGFQTRKQWEEERQGILDAIWSQDDGDDDWYGGFDPYE
jgi:hypothetical protein